MTDTDFKQWGGGMQPKETIGKRVEFKFIEKPWDIHEGPANQLNWFHDMLSTDIGAYRVVGEEKNTTALDKQVGGLHYKGKTIQPVEYIHANGLGFCEGNVVKYITRWRNKNGIADLEKAKHYIELLIELEQKSKT